MTVPQMSAMLSGLVCGRAHTVAVDAHDAAGNRSLAATVSAATADCTQPPSDTTPPTTPAGLAAGTVTQTGLTLSWSPSSDDTGVTGYDVYRNGSRVASVSSTTSNQSGLSCGTSYAFGVVARDAIGNSSPMAQLTKTTAACSTPPPPVDTTPPTQPGTLGITAASRTSVALGWPASSDNVAVTGYRPYVNGTDRSTTALTSATMSGLACGTAYTFEVEAFDAAANRSPKASTIGSTAACADSQAPTAPTNVAASSRTATSIALTWSASNDNVGVTGYGLYRGGTRIATSATTTAIFPGLACNTNYTLAVDAYDAAGNGSSQTVVMVATTACADTSPPSRSDRPGRIQRDADRAHLHVERVHRQRRLSPGTTSTGTEPCRRQ